MKKTTYKPAKYGADSLTLADEIKYAEMIGKGHTLTIDQFKRASDKQASNRKRNSEAIKKALAKKDKFLSLGFDVRKLHECFEKEMTYKQTFVLYPMTPDQFYSNKRLWKNAKKGVEKNEKESTLNN